MTDNKNNNRDFRRSALLRAGRATASGGGGSSSSDIRSSVRASMVQSFKVMDVLQRANRLQQQGRDVLHCEIGQPATGAPMAVARAAVEALTIGSSRGGGSSAHNNGSNHNHDESLDQEQQQQQQQPDVMGYTDAFGLVALRQKIATHYQTKYPLQEEGGSIPSIENIVVTTGSSGAFLLAFTACFDSGDVVAIAGSGYPCYRNILNALGCIVVSIPVNAEFKLTATELQSELDRRWSIAADHLPRIKGLILSSPSNPTGAMLSPNELQDLCYLCDEHDIQFISDEIYHGITYGKPEATALQYSSCAIVINSFSKFYSMPGWRLGWMVVPDFLVDSVMCLQQNMFISAPTIAQKAALRCWDVETLTELNGHVKQYTAARALILDELSHIADLDSSTNIAPADGGFYIYVDLGSANVLLPGFGSVQMCQELLEEQYVAFTPGIDFEDPVTNLGNRRFRISYAGGIATAQEAMKRFRLFWPEWIAQVREAQTLHQNAENGDSANNEQGS